MESCSRPSQEGMDLTWQRLVGKEAARHSWPERLFKRCLFVGVENSGWLYTLSQRKTILLQGLIELLGARQVRSLALRIREPKSG